jgi:hypothetical protein
MTGRLLIAFAAAAALLGAAACGGAEEEDASARVTCTPAPAPDRLTLGVELVRGGRIPFTYEIERDDTGDEGESFDDSIEGEIAIGARSDRGREVEWRLPGRGVTFVLAGQSSPDEIESELGEEVASGELAVPLNIREDGRVSRDTNLRALRRTVRETLTPIFTRLREEAPGEVSAEQASFLGEALGLKLIEKPGLMLYPYGYELDPDRVISRSRRSITAGGRIELVEEIEVRDQMSEGGCVVVEIRDVIEPDEVETRVGEIGEVFGTFDRDEVGELDAAYRNLIHYDAGVGLIRLVEYERVVSDGDRTVRILDRFRISDPLGP